MKFKYAIAAALSFAFVLQAEYQIAEVQNSSENPVIIGHDTKEKRHAHRIKAHSGSKILKSLLIPFISFEKNRRAFIKNEPYFPDLALKVHTSKGMFALWEDERGIICALKFDPARTERADAIPQCILKKYRAPLGTPFLASVLLIIAEDGSVSAEHLSNTKSK